MTDWQPIETIPTIDLYDLAIRSSQVLLWVSKPEKTFAVGYAYLDANDKKQVVALGWMDAKVKYWARIDPPEKKLSYRPCTCHPSDNPPVPCAGKYALNECRAAEYKVWQKTYGAPVPEAHSVEEWQKAFADTNKPKKKKKK